MNDDFTALTAPASNCIFLFDLLLQYTPKSLTCYTCFPINSTFPSPFLKMFEQISYPLPRRSGCAGRTYLIRRGSSFAHIHKVPHFFTGVTFLVQNRRWLANVWLTSTSNTQATNAFTTNEFFTRFSEALFEVVLHCFLHYNWLITC